MKPTQRTKHVFCYGSNLYPPRLFERVGPAKLIATGFVRGRRLAFHKRSVDGSAKADAFATGDFADCVWGAVYAVPDAQKATLDRFEFLGVGYDEVEDCLQVDEQTSLACSLYEARPQAIGTDLLPYDWYLQFLIAGAQQHGLPESYVQWLTQTDYIVDDDQQRRERHLRLIVDES